jgi:mRNA interferase RelE/StbE
MYQVTVARTARKELEALPAKIQDRVLRAIEKLRDIPRPAGCKKLKGADDLFRIRVGDYRIIYEVHDEEVRVLIIRVRHRKDVYE